MKTIVIDNPFGAPVYYRETVSSTMDEARLLAAGGEAHGTVICAGFQEAGRGRTTGRSWNAERGKNLFFTILLRYSDFAAIPVALTLRTGLAVSLAIEDFAPALKDRLQVKWPNDIMIGSRKTAGILAEADGRVVYIGIGVNVAQTGFPEALRAKATSILIAQRECFTVKARAGDMSADTTAGTADPCRSPEEQTACFRLLEKILARLYQELDSTSGGEAGQWRQRLEERLFRRGRRIRFIDGGAGMGRPVEGVLCGIGAAGELLIMVDRETAPRSFITGELEVYGF